MDQITSSEIIKKVRHIEITTRKAVDSILSGGYHSAFKGRGMELSEVRAYMPGDDIRAIDWNVTARSGFPYIKVFHEERELTVILVVDVSSSLKFGTRSATKREIAAEISAMVSFSAIRNNDNVGLLMFSSECEKYIPAKKGRKHALRVIREVLFHKPQGCKTSIQSALQRLSKTIKKKCLIFVISDFFDQNWQTPLTILSRKHDVIPVILNDAMETSLPGLGLVEFYDEERDLRVLVDTSAGSFLEVFSKERAQARSVLEKFFMSINVQPVFVSSTQSHVDALMRYFRYRERRR